MRQAMTLSCKYWRYLSGKSRDLDHVGGSRVRHAFLHFVDNMDISKRNALAKEMSNSAFRTDFVVNAQQIMFESFYSEKK